MCTQISRRALYLGSDGLETCGPGTRRRGSVLRALAVAASRFAVSLSADQIERFAGHGPISWLGIAEHVGDRVLLDRNLLQRSHAGHRGLGYPSTAEANEATAPEIAAHSPSDNSKTTISDAPLFSGRAAACADRSDRNGPEVVLLLRRRAWRSAASAGRRRFRKTGFAGLTNSPTLKQLFVH